MMRTSTTTSSDLYSNDLRMDASYHASTGLHANRMLNNSLMHIDRLDQVCQPSGIFIPGRFRRVYVENPENGLKWLSPTDMQKADLSGLGFISRKYTSNLENLRLHRGWILLSRSGTIGNLAYVRADMDGLIGSDDIIRIVADPKKIHSGYLYAVLCSPLILSMIKQKTYGAVIPHIEAHHIIDLSIPRLTTAQEEKIHVLIEQAAQLRVEANQLFKQAQCNFLMRIFGNTSDNSADLSSNRKRITLGLTNSTEVYSKDYRLDAGLYANMGSKIQQFLNLWRASDPQNNKLDCLGNVCIKNGIFIGGRAKRVYVNDPSNGIPFLSSSDMLIASIRHVNLISKKQPGLKKLLLQQGWTLISRSGTIGNVAYVRRDMVGLAGSEHIMRVVPDTKKIQSGYLFTFLNSSIGVSLIRQGTFGSVVDTIAPDFIETILIPRIDPEHENSIHNLVEKASENQAKANEFEDQAQSLLQASLGLPS